MVPIELRHPRGLNRFGPRRLRPESPRYRRYSTVEKLVARFGCPRLAGRARRRWNRLFDGHLRHRQSRAPARGAAGSSSRAVPAALRGVVSRIALAGELATSGAPAAVGARASAKRKRGHYGSILPHTGTAGGCPAGSSGGEPGLEPFTPNQYLTAYGHAAMHAKGLRGEGQTVAVVEEGGFNRRDIAAYARCFGAEPPPISVQVVGPAKRPPAEDETTLDLEQLTVGAPGLDRIYVYEAPESLEAIILAAGAALGKPRHRPDVISISLGICEPQLQGALAWRDALDNIFAVAAGAGISVLVSAGDQGSSGCRAFDRETGETTALPVTAVSLPASSPYVTAVGGTNLSLTRKNRIREEIV